MLIDHIAWAFVPLYTWPGQLMHFIGRLTGPTMAFFVAEGYAHTRSVPRYALRLGLFALLSWPAYCFFETGRWFGPYFGVIYTLFLGLLAVWICDRTRIPVWAKALAVAALCFLSRWGDWPVFDVLWPVALYLWRDEPERKWTAYWLLCAGAAAYCALQIDPLWRGWYNVGVFLPPLLLRYGYNGEAGSRRSFHKWFFYVFYPLHLLALAAAARGLL